jgi:hypothetical protein
VLGGAIAQWTSPYVALDTLTTPDFTWQGFCPIYPWGCNATASEGDQDSPTQCMSYTALDTVNGGPFALFSTTTPGTYQCFDPLLLLFESWTNCDTADFPIQPCYGQGDYKTDCCGNEFNFSAAPPCYS